MKIIENAMTNMQYTNKAETGKTEAGRNASHASLTNEAVSSYAENYTEHAASSDASAAIEKALEEAELPKNEKNTSIVRQLLDNHMSIDKDSLRRFISQTNIFKEADISTLLLMNKNDIPINHFTASQLQGYINNEQGLMNQLNDVVDGTMEFLLNTDENGIQANLQILDILTDANYTAEQITGNMSGTDELSNVGSIPGTDVFSNTGSIPGTIPGTDKLSGAGDIPGSDGLLNTETMPGAKDLSNAGSFPGTDQNLNAITLPGTNVSQNTGALSGTDGLLNAGTLSGADKLLNSEAYISTDRSINSDTLTNADRSINSDTLTNADRLINSDTLTNTDRPINSDTLTNGLINTDTLPVAKDSKNTDGAAILQAANGLSDNSSKQNSGISSSQDKLPASLKRLLELKETLKGADESSLRNILKSEDYRNAIKNELVRRFTLKPEDIKNADSINKFYRDTFTALTKMQEIAKQADSEMAQSFTKPMNNIKFMDTLNNVFPYVQLPLQLDSGKTHGELYIFKNGRNKNTQNDAKSVLLHLDMEHLGPTDIHMELNKKHLAMKFYGKDEKSLQVLSGNINILNSALEKKGYNITAEFKISEDSSVPMSEALSGGAENEPSFSYNFDIRA